MISEEYKNDIKTRILKELITCCTAIIPNVLLNFFIPYKSYTNSIMVVLVLFIAASLCRMSYYVAVFKDENLLKKHYIKEYDERNVTINRKTAESTLQTLQKSLIMATIFSGYFDQTVFFSLLFASLWSILLIVAFKLYYNRKY